MVFVTRPALALAAPLAASAVLFGRPKFAWFIILKTSALNVTFASSFSLKLFPNARSRLASPGPMIVFLPTFPYVPARGKEKLQGS